MEGGKSAWKKEKCSEKSKAIKLKKGVGVYLFKIFLHSTLEDLKYTAYRINIRAVLLTRHSTATPRKPRSDFMPDTSSQQPASGSKRSTDDR